MKANHLALNVCIGVCVLAGLSGGTNGLANDSTRPIGNGDLRSGDIVFQDSAPHSGQAEQIKALTKSSYSHCGIYFVRPDGSAVVVEAGGKDRPYRSWEKWRAAGEEGKYEAKRLIQGLSDEQAKELWRVSLRYAGKPYDFKFDWDPVAIYCSELVWKAYKDSLGLEVGQLQKLGDFDLDSTEAKALIERPQSWGSVKMVPRDRDAISPQKILESPLLKTVSRP